MLGLGSWLRNVGRHADAIRTLTTAVSEFPADAALPAFLALALHSHGDHTQAMTTLLDLVLKHAPIGQYARALRQYRDTL